MLQLLVITLFVASTQGIAYTTPPRRFTAASPAQIRFAIENSFDDTGPGAKKPEGAYRVFKNLDEAILAYVNDPNTQLPQHEKARAIAKLYRSDNRMYSPQPPPPPPPPKKYSSLVNRPRVLPIILSSYSKLLPSHDFVFPHSGEKLVGDVDRPTTQWHSELPPQPSPNYGGKYHGFSYQYKPHPEVEFSIDVHDKETGDVKNVQELRDGSGTVHGYFTVPQQGGRSHTGTYEAVPQQGYHAIQSVFQ